MSQEPRAYKRAAAHQIEARRIRILGWVQSGMSFGEIAALEDLSRERVRQIVAEGLKHRDEDRDLDPRKLTEVRLEPALRLAAQRVNEGHLQGVDRLLRVIAAMEKYGPTKKKPIYDENARARLLAKLNLNLQKLPPRPESPQENSPSAPGSL
jgi:hypothetical protein